MTQDRNCVLIADCYLATWCWTLYRIYILVACLNNEKEDSTHEEAA